MEQRPLDAEKVFADLEKKHFDKYKVKVSKSNT